jgi:AraC-like DNA-binding protein
LIQRLFEGEGTTFTEYVLAQRLVRAHRLLTDPLHVNQKVGAISLDAGFGDLSYFNRAFRRRYGITPSELRAATRSTNERQGIPGSLHDVKISRWLA